MFAEEHGVPLELELVSLMQGAQKAPEYLALNPNGAVPLLEDGDLRLIESSAILKYLADKVGSPFVAPNTTGAQIRDGNLALNRVAINGAVSGLNLGRGEVLTLRWSDFDARLANGGQAADDALGIDDFVFTPTLAAVPEPTAWAMMICGFGLAGAAVRRRRALLAA